MSGQEKQDTPQDQPKAEDRRRLRPKGQQGVTPDPPTGNDQSVSADSDTATPPQAGEPNQEPIPADATPNAQQRIRQLAKERNELKAQRDAIQAELLAARAALQAGVQQPSIANQPQEAGVTQEDLEIPEYPELGSPEEIRAWHLKVAEVQAKKEAMRLSQEIAQALGPFVSEVAQSRREREWQELAPVLERAGTSREELEPTVAEILAKEPSRGLKSVAYQVMFDVLGLDGFVPADQDPTANPPNVAQPASNNAGRDSESESDDPFTLLREAKKSGNRALQAQVVRKVLLRPNKQG